MLNTYNSDTVDINSELLETFIGHCHQRRYPARIEILQPGDAADTLYYVVEGSVSIILEDSAGQEIVLAYLNPGDFLGAIGVFLALNTRKAYAKTRSATVLAEISYRELQALLDGDLAERKADFLVMMGAHISQRLMRAERKVGDLALLDITGRIARVLLDLIKQPGAATHPEGVSIKVTRTEMARLVGCSREMAGRCLKEMESRGLIISKGRTIIVKHQFCNEAEPDSETSRV